VDLRVACNKKLESLNFEHEVCDRLHFWQCMLRKLYLSTW